MADSKKISFGFSKISKKPTLVAPKKEENEIQFIDCLEGNSIKLVNGEEKAKEALVIPLKNGNILRDNMIEALKARKEENSTKNGVMKEKEKHSEVDSKVNAEESDKTPLTLDELAAKEILEDLKKSEQSEDVKDIREIPASNASTIGEKESTIEDYENVPINEFGLAMLRGMGWAPDKGIGKNGQVIQPVNPIVRPKGMGLGADKVMPTTIRSKTGEELVMKKSALLKIISGPHKNLYGKVEGFDELPGRIMVRLALQNIVISISENLVQLVTSEEYNKNSKILNLNDYNKYYEEKDLKTEKENVKNSIKSEPSDGKPQNLKNQQSDSDNELENSSRKQYKGKATEVNKREKAYSSSPERNSKYNKYSTQLQEGKRKTCIKKERKASSDSVDEEEYEEKKEIKRSGYRYEPSIKFRKERRHSPSPEDRHRRYKSKKEKRSSSSSSEYEHKSTKLKKHKSRNYSSSSDNEKEKSKEKNKYKSQEKSHTLYSKKKSKHKSRRDRSSSSDYEAEKKSKDRKYESKKHLSTQRHSRKDKNHTSDFESDLEEQKRRKQKSYSRQRSTSRSPSRKKKKKHHKSRS